MKKIITTLAAIAMLTSTISTVPASAYTTNDYEDIYEPNTALVTIGAKPAKVKVKAKYTSGCKAVKINWNKVKNATGYRVYRYNGKKWVKVANCRKTAYKITGLKAGTKYKFKVKAFKRTSKGTVWGKASAVKNTVTKPNTPKFAAASATQDSIKLRWNKVNCDGYQVYQKINGSFKKIATVKGADSVTYKAENLKCSTKYNFKVRAYIRDTDKNIRFSSFSDKNKTTADYSWTGYYPGFVEHYGDPCGFGYNYKYVIDEGILTENETRSPVSEQLFIGDDIKFTTCEYYGFTNNFDRVDNAYFAMLKHTDTQADRDIVRDDAVKHWIEKFSGRKGKWDCNNDEVWSKKYRQNVTIPYEYTYFELPETLKITQNKSLTDTWEQAHFDSWVCFYPKGDPSLYDEDSPAFIGKKEVLKNVRYLRMQVYSMLGDSCFGRLREDSDMISCLEVNLGFIEPDNYQSNYEVIVCDNLAT